MALPSRRSPSHTLGGLVPRNGRCKLASGSKRQATVESSCWVTCVVRSEPLCLWDCVKSVRLATLPEHLPCEPLYLSQYAFDLMQDVAEGERRATQIHTHKVTIGRGFCLTPAKTGTRVTYGPSISYLNIMKSKQNDMYIIEYVWNIMIILQNTSSTYPNRVAPTPYFCICLMCSTLRYIMCIIVYSWYEMYKNIYSCIYIYIIHIMHII